VEDVCAFERGDIIEFLPAYPIKPEVAIEEKLCVATEYFCTLSNSINAGVPNLIEPDKRCIEKAKSLLENYVEYKYFIDSLLSKLPARIPAIHYDGKTREGFELTVFSEKDPEGTLLGDSTVLHPDCLYSSFHDIRRCSLYGLDPFAEFPPFRFNENVYRRQFYPRCYSLNSRERAVIEHVLNERNRISSYVIEIQCLSRLSELEWSDSFSRIIFGLVFSKGEMGRVCDLIADQLADPRNFKFLESQISAWRDASKTNHLPFKIIRTLCALSKRGRSARLASIVVSISSRLSVNLGTLEKSMLLDAGNQDLFNELKDIIFYRILQQQYDNFTAEDQSICFALESLRHSNKLGRQVVHDVLAYIEHQDGCKRLIEVARGLR
jgi:hypothetical protein